MNLGPKGIRMMADFLTIRKAIMRQTAEMVAVEHQLDRLRAIQQGHLDLDKLEEAEARARSQYRERKKAEAGAEELTRLELEVSKLHRDVLIQKQEIMELQIQEYLYTGEEGVEETS